MLQRIDNLMEKIEEVILVYGTILMAILLVINVLLRTFFNSSLTFAEEASQILLMSVTFIGLSYASRHGRNIRISALHEYSNSKLRRILATIISLVTFLTLLWLAYVSLEYVINLKQQNRLTPVLHIPVYISTSVVVYGLFTSAIQYIHIFILNIKNNKCYIGITPESEDDEVMNVY